ncbi:ECF transporter S component [Enterococcus columbae]|uniref:Riboflavin transporter n=1 Tax=Enterococcus columbae DSM 7374 = ATCC 51263 TaxID=1121865 RepID=S0KCS0_9ENTE|nr:ECF transporter S component [Enterococcus columbae]EOT42492.1 membrane protein [Enterococcus columbae DSM 7374 = ATCC 51263]EOW87572.1 membrane protein [Enterococcus columbae DSM 7374 = ATCC 51263]OJG23126.1 membrane protein [Enterococcus columbae DSM 7374 = ATCC 51263]
MQSSKVQQLVGIAVLGAMGLILQYLAFPIFPALGFLKIDFSDIPVLIGMFLFGPFAGIATAFIRSFLHLLTTGIADPANLVGDVASFLASMVFSLPIYYFFKEKLNRKNQLLGIGLGILSLTIFMSVANYLVITPLYLKFYGLNADQLLGMTLAKYIAIGIIPFNLIKGVLVSGVFVVLHAKLLPWLSKKKIRSNVKHRGLS